MGTKKNSFSVFELNNLLNPKLDYKDKLGNYLGTDYTYNTGITTDMMGADLQDYSDIGKYGMTGKNLTDIDRMNRALDTGRETGKITQQQFEDAFYGDKEKFGSRNTVGNDPIIYTGTGTGTDTGTTTDGS